MGSLALVSLLASSVFAAPLKRAEDACPLLLEADQSCYAPDNGFTFDEVSTEMVSNCGADGNTDKDCTPADDAEANVACLTWCSAFDAGGCCYFHLGNANNKRQCHWKAYNTGDCGDKVCGTARFISESPNLLSAAWTKRCSLEYAPAPSPSRSPSLARTTPTQAPAARTRPPVVV